MDEFGLRPSPCLPTAARPLLGLTILVVEDSRFASEALRLLCLRSGARIRRADCLTSARRHLQVYRPSAILIDLGLPDGSGADLISDVNAITPRISVVLGISGDDNAEARALAAGADGFLAKPVSSLTLFQQAILAHLPAERQPSGPRALNDTKIRPDRAAYRDDLAHVADLLGDRQTARSLAYLAQFLHGVAHSADDAALACAAQNLAQTRHSARAAGSELARLEGMVQDRLASRMAL
ncbi:response regulator [Aquicoccus sp. G2-2]|uniref:response regulator n=1 Tax=Aquicoccus sp. G2-2 TaxID=3092120 RepID=UPI002ADFA66F|nr:response regulator [Aquicoccus sp. G2-2]MEA1112176.1 response regulator [Aquicoccus sp. G2-2]